MLETQPDVAADTARFLKRQGFHAQSVGMILGTGFGRFAEQLQIEARIPYNQIPGFPVSTVAEHAGNLLNCRYSEISIAIMQGRIHRYEGYSPDEVAFPVRVMHHLGIRTLFVTCAAGGLNPFFRVGDLMMIEDHINMMGGAPLPVIGDPDPVSGPVYDAGLQKTLISVASKRNITLRSGILTAMLGPSFETPAEIAMLRQQGADAVSMSTVPEVVVASQLGVHIAGVSCISNMCVGSMEPVNHEDVALVVNAAGERFSSLMTGFFNEIKP